MKKRDRVKFVSGVQDDAELKKMVKLYYKTILVSSLLNPMEVNPEHIKGIAVEGESPMNRIGLTRDYTSLVPLETALEIVGDYYVEYVGCNIGVNDSYYLYAYHFIDCKLPIELLRKAYKYQIAFSINEEDEYL